MSNLTSASGEASVSSGNRTEAGSNYPPPHHHHQQQYFSATTNHPPPTQTQPAKKKRNLPGNPDPDAEVIALSPKTLMATNRFVCEICNKGFQRDQNLQLHRRGHNLPWKLKQRTSKEVRKKVYVCPEASCVHHDPSRALGDLTGIKKHFSRKHGEKKWKCEKCSKRYAVQSDWKAHSKTCGTREYRCDCGTLFSRRDSFITHRAFCDALAEESAKAITGGVNVNPVLLPSSASASHINLQIPQQIQFNPQEIQIQPPFSLKKEQQSFSIPPWLATQPMLGPGPGPPVAHPQPLDLSSSTTSASIFSTRLDHHHHHHQEFSQTLDVHDHQNPNSTTTLGVGPTTLHNSYNHPTSVPSPHMSATALLQKAAQMGATMSTTTKTGSSSAPLNRPHQQTHVSADSSGSNNNNNNTTAGNFGLNLSSREEELAIGTTTGSNSTTSFLHGLASFGAGNHKTTTSSSAAAANAGAPPSLFQDMMNSFSSASGFDATSFDDDAFGAILNSKKGDHHGSGSFINESMSFSSKTTTRNDRDCAGNGGQGEGLTRDFLGLRAFSHNDILNMAGLSNCMNTSQSHEQRNVDDQSQKQWQG
ncbi:Zinc finger, C2H2 [Corchorus capsularis]|uniref:Zinc finger, C2H2 n=1 Tax=Corchorus capsularis TaxID=210143 RepID=A0A1R3HK79_COCAP|nr:Zinc finger, C2H2 [Corchorus capsularis]